MAENKKLNRSSSNKVIGGVCAGLADFLNLDVALVRIAFVIAMLFASFGIWLYIILWIVLPIEGQQTTDNGQQYSASESASKPMSKTNSIFAGISIIFIGLIFLVNNFLPISWIWKLWPLILVAIGVIMIINATKKGGDNE